MRTTKTGKRKRKSTEETLTGTRAEKGHMSSHTKCEHLRRAFESKRHARKENAIPWRKSKAGQSQGCDKASQTTRESEETRRKRKTTGPKIQRGPRERRRNPSITWISPASRSHDPLCCFGGGVSPLASRARGLVFASSCLNASLMLSNLESTLPSKWVCLCSKRSNLASRESSRLESAGAVLVRLTAVHGAGSGGVGFFLFLDAFFPLPFSSSFGGP